MASGIDTHGFPSSDSNASVCRPVPQSGTETIKLQRMEPPGSTASTPRARSRRGDKDTTSSPKSFSGSRRIGGNLRKQETFRSRRVRTGCFTCRERHLKCDEALHQCQNCRRSGRVCKRGVRLNFIDTQTAAPPYCVALPPGAQIAFRDDSRLIASEYVGGFERYPPPGPDPLLGRDLGSPFEFFDSLEHDVLAESNMSMDDSFLPEFGHSLSDSAGVLVGINPALTPPSPPRQTVPHTPSGPEKQVSANYCTGRIYTPHSGDTFLLRAFVEEVGCWIDSLDTVKHFTQILPFHALEQPLIKTAFMACGARHLHLTIPIYEEGDTLYYYDEAAQHLRGSLQNPDRDSTMCAAAAVVLSICELMCSTTMFRMNHSARTLAKACGWDGRTPGLGGLCFWLSASMELLTCLHFNWTFSWDPDAWGIDMDMDDDSSKVVGDEELWIHRIIYICAKISNFRSSASPQQTDNPANGLTLSQRCHEWKKFNDWCDRWQEALPRSMMPLSYVLFPENSEFPKVWLVKRAAVIARLLYHTARILLAKTNPLEPESSPEMRRLRECNASDICGIVAHMNYQGMATFPIWFLIIGAECLTRTKARIEALEIVDDIVDDNDFRAEYIKNGLRQAWGWDTPTSHQTPTVGPVNGHSVLDSATTFSTRRELPSGIANPIMTTADFSVEGRPYQDHYVPRRNRINPETIGPSWF